MSATDVLFDFCIMAVLLFIAQIIHVKVRFIQKLYIPSALIAGIIGLICGQYFLDVLPFSIGITSYSSILIAVLFSTLFLGSSEKISIKKIMHSVGDTFLVNTFGEVGQWGLFLIIGATIFPLVFTGLHDGFALMLPAGFIGGHGTAAAIGSAFASAGWEEAASIGQTTATIGLVLGILLGVLSINIATKKGYTRVIKEVHTLPEEFLTGLVPKEKRQVMAENTINSMSMDPFGWHLVLVLISVGGAYLLNYGLRKVFPTISFPIYGMALIVSFAVQMALNGIGFGDYVDKRAITRIGSAATDFLVGFGVATINVHVVVKYLAPIIVLAIIGFIYCILFLFVFSKKFFHNYWFERGIYCFGLLTGVMSTGVILLRVCDPEFKTGVLEDFGMAWLILSFVDLLCVSLTPVFVINGKALMGGIVLCLLAIACLIGSKLIYGINHDNGIMMREGEIK